jgi:UDP-2-acetamido-2,6-beta-L-arabino-hexul-4-ose reductase
MNVEVKKLAVIADNRGWLTELLKNEPSQTIEQIHFSVSKPGALRGNHYHKHRSEWLAVTSGVGKVFLEDNITKEKSEMMLSADCPALIKIYPNITHAIVNCGDALMHLLVITNQKHDSKDTDTYQKNIAPFE